MEKLPRSALQVTFQPCRPPPSIAQPQKQIYDLILYAMILIMK